MALAGDADREDLKTLSGSGNKEMRGNRNLEQIAAKFMYSESHLELVNFTLIDST